MFVVNRKRNAVLTVLSVVWTIVTVYTVVGVLMRSGVFVMALISGDDWKDSFDMGFEDGYPFAIWPVWILVLLVVALLLTFSPTIGRVTDDEIKERLLHGIKKQIRKTDSLATKQGYVLWTAVDEEWPARFKLVADGGGAFTVTKITEGKDGEPHEDAYLTFSYDEQSLTSSRGCSLKEMYKLRDMLRDARKRGEQGPLPQLRC